MSKKKRPPAGSLVILRNLARCTRCLDVIESKDRYDMVECQCGAIFVDGGRDFIRRGFALAEDLDELSEIVEL